MTNLDISNSAKDYLLDLISKQEEETNIRIFVTDPGTPRAETCIVYCLDGEEEATDEKINFAFTFDDLHPGGWSGLNYICLPGMERAYLFN